MDEDTLNANLKTVKELVLDEQKIVTYISLSKELCIHVNEAKWLLSQTVKDIRQTIPSSDIYVFYLISGLLDTNIASTKICPENEVESLKKSLKSIFFEHVYCVSRGMKSVDIAALSAVSSFEDLPLCIGLIKDGSCTKRTDDEIGNLKLVHVPKQEVKISQNKKSFSHGHIDNKNRTISETVKSENVSPKKVPSPNKDISPKKGHVKKNGVKPTTTKSIAGFFSKANGDVKKPNVVNNGNKKEVEKPEAVNVKVKEEPMDTTDKKSVITENKTIPNSLNTKETNKAKEESNKNNSSLSKIKRNAKIDKKRKRLLRVSDSESDTEANDPFADEMAVDQESEDEIPPTPTIVPIKITSSIINPKKRRKIVDKTYTDEDGYILTKKEEVYVSCSDNEEDNKHSEVKENIKVNEAPKPIQIKSETSPKENSKGKKKKVSPPQKGTQKTMMNFFKKV